jgi:hypothetical protein
MGRKSCWFVQNSLIAPVLCKSCRIVYQKKDHRPVKLPSKQKIQPRKPVATGAKGTQGHERRWRSAEHEVYSPIAKVPQCHESEKGGKQRRKLACCRGGKEETI